jgi:nucleoside-diphosphate-sugar epimerase
MSATTLLVLGGTSFVGRALVTEALADGHQVSVFNRGMTNPDLFPNVEKLRGDRTSDLSALSGRRWDVAVDVAGYEPGVVQRSVDTLAESVDRYVFVSTLSVYKDHSTTEAQREAARLLDIDHVVDPGELYGARKAACERVVLEAFGPRATIARAGLIVGPHDRTTRFVAWPRRMAEGGTVLAPGRPDDPLQFIDVRDLAAWLLRAAVLGTPGVFNVTGPETRFQELLEACRHPDVEAELVWVPSTELLAAGLDPWMGVPLWIAAPGWEAANRVDIALAMSAGLTHRPLTETIRGAMTHPGDDGSRVLSVEAERELLRGRGR